MRGMTAYKKERNSFGEPEIAEVQFARLTGYSEELIRLRLQ